MSVSGREHRGVELVLRIHRGPSETRWVRLRHPSKPDTSHVNTPSAATSLTTRERRRVGRDSPTGVLKEPRGYDRPLAASYSQGPIVILGGHSSAARPVGYIRCAVGKAKHSGYGRSGLALDHERAQPPGRWRDSCRFPGSMMGHRAGPKMKPERTGGHGGRTRQGIFAVKRNCNETKHPETVPA